MKRVEIEILSESPNCPVVRIPGRKFPGIVVQGDSLKILLDHIIEIEELSSQYSDGEVSAAVAHLKSILVGYIEEFQSTMKSHMHSLPYPE